MKNPKDVPLLMSALRLKQVEILAAIRMRYEKGESYVAASERVFAEQEARIHLIFGQEAVDWLRTVCSTYGVGDLPRESRLKHYLATQDPHVELTDLSKIDSGPMCRRSLRMWTIRGRSLSIYALTECAASVLAIMTLAGLSYAFSTQCPVAMAMAAAATVVAGTTLRWPTGPP